MTLGRTTLLRPAHGVRETLASQPLPGLPMNHITTAGETKYEGAAHGLFATEKERFTRDLLAFVKR